MGLRWHIPLPGPFSMSGNVFPHGRRRRARRRTKVRTRYHSRTRIRIRGGIPYQPVAVKPKRDWAKELAEQEATMTPRQLVVRNWIAAGILIGVVLLILL